MSTFGGQPQPPCRGSDGALMGRAARPRSGPRRAPGTLERSGKVYGATPRMTRVDAEAHDQGAGSQIGRGSDARHSRPHGSAAGGSGHRIANRRFGVQNNEPTEVAS